MDDIRSVSVNEFGDDRGTVVINYKDGRSTVVTGHVVHVDTSVGD